MQDKEFELSSGAKLHVSVAGFQDAKALTKALVKTLAGVDLAEDVMSLDVTVLKDIFVNAATSSDVEASLMRCMERALYNGNKITVGLFDDPGIGEALRADYIPICAKIIEVNCAPFFVQALSSLKTLLAKKPVSQQS